MSYASTWTADWDRKKSFVGHCRPSSVGFAYYRTDHELTFYLRALQRIRCGRLVVVLGLQSDRTLPADLPTNVRLILTAEANSLDPQGVVGLFVPDPRRAVRVALAGLQPTDGLILLFPTDWKGEPPDSLVDKAHHPCATPVPPQA